MERKNESVRMLAIQCGPRRLAATMVLHQPTLQNFTNLSMQMFLRCPFNYETKFQAKSGQQCMSPTRGHAQGWASGSHL
eukprot:996587-Pelagomonas_calceolata.AAC.1